MRRNAARFLALMVAAAPACARTQYVIGEDAGADAPRDTGIDAALADVPPDVPLRDAPSFDAGRYWGGGSCLAAVEDGTTGDACLASSLYCGSPDLPVSLRSGTSVLCDLSGRLLVWDVTENAVCEAPAPAPWDGADCAAAIEGGDAGQACTGSWRCVEVADDPCCIELAGCNPGRFGNRDTPPDRLMRSRVCQRGCPYAPIAGRPLREGCPPDVYVAGEPELQDGDACSGSWACLIPMGGFAAYPDSTLPVIPVWCDGSVFHYTVATGVGSPVTYPPFCD